MSVPPALADELMAATTGLWRLVRRRMRTEMSGPRLRGAQVELLRVVERNPGVGVAKAAQVMHLAGNSVSTVVNQLVEAGMLHRDPDTTDRRAVCLSLTPVAKQRLENWRQERTRFVGTGLERLPDGDIQAIQQALPALQRLIGELETETCA